MKSDSDDHLAAMTHEQALNHINILRENISKYLFGQEELIEETLTTFLASGHLLITGAPGLAKTTLVRIFSQNLSLKFGRVQFTPDMLPSDIIGSEILNIDTNTGKRNFEFQKGPIFVQLLLADEINRASPRTQSAMLEAMQERQVTISGKSHKLAPHFMVLATQNPMESEGTFPLPEAQMDRFLMHSILDYPKKNDELQILKEHAQAKLAGETYHQKNEDKHESLKIDIDKIKQKAQNIAIHESLLAVINDLVRNTRPQKTDHADTVTQHFWYGAGPRAGISLVSAAKSYAMICGQEQVRWRHIKRMYKPVLRHRVKLNSFALQEGFDIDHVLEQILVKIENNHKNLLSNDS